MEYSNKNLRKKNGKDLTKNKYSIDKLNDTVIKNWGEHYNVSNIYR